MERGFDLSSEEGINQWMATYNAELAAGAGLPIPLPGERSENARQFHDRLKPRTVLGMYQMDPNWTLPSKIDDNRLAWMIQVKMKSLMRLRQQLSTAGTIPHSCVCCRGRLLSKEPGRVRLLITPTS